MLNFFRRSKSLEHKLSETKDIEIHNVKFKIRKLNALDYLDGSRAMIQSYDEYAIKKNDNKFPDAKKLKQHLTDVIMAGVVNPILTRDKNKDGIYIENLFTDIDLANELYTSIMMYTYGKKKV